uniref:Uncharacterized protein n=1 Tax=Sipha flava TaxID=143950 RepID=A0A2S2R0X2_9HEMI
MLLTCFIICRQWCSNFNTLFVRGSCVVFVFVLSVMLSYSNTELADMNFIYGLCNRNTRASQREYENRFPGRRVPAPGMLSKIHQALRERGTFIRSLRKGVHNTDLEKEILNETNRDPETSTRALARQFDVRHSTVWRTINRESLYHLSISFFKRSWFKEYWPSTTCSVL